MRACYHIEILTPKKVVLNGLWFGPRKAKTVLIFLHGLGGSMFSLQALQEQLAESDTALLTFNNRGFEKVTKLRRVNSKTRAFAGAALERFTDCVDDIEGAIRSARGSGAKRIFLIGHSTGCQKAIYWAAKKGKGVKGIVLLAPISDYSTVVKDHGKARYQAALKAARSLVRAGKADALLPQDIWPALDSAQRFLSLYTPDSVEELFPYAQVGKKPRLLASVTTPLFAVFAEEDEHGDRPAGKIADWFLEHIYTGETMIVPNASHGFKDAEKIVAREMKDWITRT